MARRSRGLQQVVDNFMRGLQMGWGHQDKIYDREAKIAAAAFQRQKWAEEAQIKRENLAINRQKANDYGILSRAHAGYYDRSQGKGGGGGDTGISDNARAWIDETGGMTFNPSSPQPQRQVVASSPMPAAPMPPGGSDNTGGGSSENDARGGKVGAYARGGGVGRALAAGVLAGANNFVRYRNADLYRRQGTPPFNPDPNQKIDPTAPTYPIGGIQRVNSTQTYGGTGTTGPGSGFGERAAPPQAAINTEPPVVGETYRRGGVVRKFQEGGVQRPRIQGPGKPTLLSTMADMLGTPFGLPNISQRFPAIRDQSVPGNSPPTASTPGPGQPLPPRFTNDDRAASTAWAEGRGGPPQIRRTDRTITPPPQVAYDDVDYQAHPSGTPPAPSPPGQPTLDYSAFDERTNVAPVRPTGAAGGRGGGAPRGGGLGDQRREAAYDPIKDRMDPRNIGVVDDSGGVNPMVYAATQHGGIELTHPSQRIYRRGGIVIPNYRERVRRPGGGLNMAEGGAVETVNRNNQSLAQNLLMQDVEQEKQDQDYGAPRTGRSRAAAASPSYAFDFGSADGATGAGGTGTSDTGEAGSVGGTAAGPGTSGETFRRGGRVAKFDGGGRLPVPIQPGGWGGGDQQQAQMPPQGGGEPYDDGQAEADALTQKWREEAYAAAQANQQAGGVPSLPDRDPQWAQDIRSTQPMLEAVHGTGQETGSAPPYRPDTSDPGPAHAGATLPPLPDAPPIPSPRMSPNQPGRTELPPEPAEPYVHDESKGSPGQTYIPGDENAPKGPGAPPARRAPPSNGAAAPASTAGQDEADRLTREWNAKNQAGQGVGPITKKGAVDTTPPMAQGTYEPEGGTGLRGPGPGVSTNNAARDYLGAATTFADWAMKDAGPQNKDQAQAALFSGKGAADAQQIGAIMMAVDPENKMPLDKRFEAAAKMAHDFHVANGDVKQAAETAFSVMQFGVTKAREHGAQAVKALQAGDEQAALKEIMAGYTWLADRATARVADGSIVVTGEDGKVRAQIPLQPGTVNNLAMGMMSGQLPWDAIRRGSSAAAGPAPPPTSGVQTGYPATGSSGGSSQPAQPQAAPTGPAAPPAAAPTLDKPSKQAIDTTPPQAQPKPAPAVPAAAPAPAPRPSSASQPARTGGAQTKLEPLPPKVTEKPKEPGSKAGDVTSVQGQRYVWDGKEWIQSSVSKATAEAKPATEAKVTPASTGTKSETKTETKSDTTADDKKAEKELREHWAKNPYEPPPGYVESRTPSQAAGVKQIDDALEANQKEYDKAIQDLYIKADQRNLTRKERSELLPKRIAEIKAKADHNRNRLEKQRDELVTRERAAQDREAAKEPKEVTPATNRELTEAFEKRAQEIQAAKSRGKDDPEKQAALKRSALRWMVDAGERKQLDHIAKEIWRDNHGKYDPSTAFDLAVGATEIHKEGKGRNLQTGQYATSFQPIARTPSGGYVLLTDDGDHIRVSADTYKKIQGLHQQNWRQQQREDKMKEADDARQKRSLKGLGSRVGKALEYVNPYTLPLAVGRDIVKGTR